MNKKTLNIGHRGARGHVAENTLESIKKALEFDADGVEIDVFKCKSGEIVVIHDETVNRTTNAIGNVEDFTLTELKSITVEGKYKIPTLEEVLDVLDARYLLNIELKGRNTAKATSDIIENYIDNKGWKPKQFVVSSFEWDELRDFYQLNKEIPIGILTEENPLDAINVAKELNAVAIHPYYVYLLPEVVDSIHKEGLKVYTWTVNEPKDIKTMLNIGVDAIITDYPERVIE
ncbi:glycerophosphodiester phosphodiesterase [Abyssalbus ytuae]|uniref:Glycerophosphodiester phosphodiesterase n=1 Tax=Abyssalbus ytuae TaxID=2926907 RepID=A0A9E7D317_9FLAO|nr:glycerophosphodiester phosphodiesterase family protein [Abyssalbus ytuae]UOB18788.1 glycerophosphodiester phosphodiesterase [Abyssalbus ytuae]